MVEAVEAHGVGRGEAVSGACLCGAAQFSGRLKYGRIFDVCHCGMCRRWAGGPWFGVGVEGLLFAEPKSTRAFGSSAWAERVACATCGGALAYRLIEQDHAAVALGAINGSEAFEFFEQIFVDQKPANYDFANATSMKTEAECVAAFMTEFKKSADG